MTERLVARTRRLDVEPDLVASCGDEGLLVSSPDLGVLGHGVSLRIAADRSSGRTAQQVADVLGAIEVERGLDVPGTGAVALGAFPFRPDAPGELVVPRIVVGRNAEGDDDKCDDGDRHGSDGEAAAPDDTASVHPADRDSAEDEAQHAPDDGQDADEAEHRQHEGPDAERTTARGRMSSGAGHIRVGMSLRVHGQHPRSRAQKGGRRMCAGPPSAVGQEPLLANSAAPAMM